MLLASLALACMEPVVLQVGDSGATSATADSSTADTAPDDPETTWRHREYPAYKAHRSETAEALKEAAREDYVREYVEVAGWQFVMRDGYEADGDCNDHDPDVHPLAYDVCDGVDTDCNGVIDDATDCPCPINHHDGGTYLFCESASPWEEAREVCLSVGYDLVAIGGPDENEWLHDTAALLTTRSWWTGLNDRDDEGTFTWVSGEAVDWTNWDDGEPNDWGRGEDCMAIHSASNDEWNDLDCEDTERFICEVR